MNGVISMVYHGTEEHEEMKQKWEMEEKLNTWLGCVKEGGRNR